MGYPITPFNNLMDRRMDTSRMFTTRLTSDELPTRTGNGHLHRIDSIDKHLHEWFLSHLNTHHTDIDGHLHNHEYSQNINQNPSNEPNWLPGLVGAGILIGFLGIAWGVF